MPFGNKAKPCSVYEYGCFPPVSGGERLNTEIRKRNNLWNKLVEISEEYETLFHSLHAEAAENAGFNKAQFEADEQEAATLFDKIVEFEKEIKDRIRGAIKGTEEEIDALREEKRSLQSIWHPKNDVLKKTKKAIRDANPQPFIDLKAEKKQAIKNATHSFGLWWQNRDEELREYEMAWKSILDKRTKGIPVSLNFHGFAGCGKVTVRLRERGLAGEWGMPTQNIFTLNNTFYIEPVDPSAWDSPSRSVRRKAARTKVYFRLSSSKDGDPVWVVLPMVMHRPLPEGTLIRQASIITEKVGRKMRYKLVVTVEKPERSIDLKRNGAVAIDIGWRKIHKQNGQDKAEENIRVARWVDSVGLSGEVLLDQKILGAFSKLEDLRSIRDKNFNNARAKLVAFLKQNSAPDVPDWLLSETTAIDKWRSPNRLLWLLEKWHNNPFPAGQDIYLELRAWRKQEHHLYDWESNLRDKVIKHRREEYRKIAKQMADTYQLVVIEDFKINKVAKIKKKDKKKEKGERMLEQNIGNQRVVGATSLLRAAILNACSREGAEILKVPSPYTTQACHACGHMANFDAMAYIFHRCLNCRTLWDQDYNACVNMLKEAHKAYPAFAK